MLTDKNMESYANTRIQVADLIVDFSSGKAGYVHSESLPEPLLQSEVELDDKSLRLLYVLLHSENHKASREHLLSAIWENKIVSDDSLTNLVSQTRARLKLVSTCNIILTLPKKGYAIDCEVVVLNKPDVSVTISSSTSQPSTSPAPYWIVFGVFALLIMMTLIWVNQSDRAHYDETIAVLPIDAMSQEPGIVNASMSLTEELTHQLTHYPALKVVSRTLASGIDRSALTREQLSEILNSRYFVEGSIRENADKLRLTLQLIDGQSGLHVFSQVVDALHNEFQSQREQIIQSMSRLVVSEIPFGINEASQVELQVYIERCDSYLEIGYLYALHKLLNIEAIAAQAEPACLVLAQVSENAELLSKPAELYLFMAQASVKQRNQRLAYLELGKKYVAQGLAKLPENEALLDVSLKLWNYELLDTLNYKSDPTTAFKSVVEIGEKARALYPENDDFINTYAVAMRRYGVSLARKGQSPVEYFDKGIRLFEQGIALFPDNHVLVHNLGRLYTSYSSYLNAMGEDHISMLKSSMVQYEKAIAMEPDYYDAHVNIGNAYNGYTKYLARKDQPYQDALSKARHHYQKAINLTERKQQVHNNLSSLNAALAQIELWRGRRADDVIRQGIDHAKLALDSQPDYIWPHFNLMDLHYYRHLQGYALGGQGIDSGEQCIDFAAKGHALKDNLASTWHTMTQCGQLTARMYLESGNNAAAIRLLEEIEGWLAHARSLNAKAVKGQMLYGTNRLLMAIARQNPRQDYQSVLAPFERALTLKANDFDVKIATLEALVFFHRVLPSDLQSAVKKLVPTFNENEQQKMAYQLLSLLLEDENLTMRDWHSEVLKRQEHFGLTAQLYQRQYQYLLPQH